MSSATWFDEYVVETGFLARYPQYAAVLAQLVPVDTPAVETMAVTFRNGRYYLLYNDAWFRDHAAYRAGILLHEVHHIALGHVVGEKFRHAKRRDLMELAMEMAANELITEPLPDGAVVWQQFAHLGIRAGQSTLERYEVLLGANDDEATLAAAARPWVDDHDPGIGASVIGTTMAPGGTAATRQLLEQAFVAAQDLAGGSAGDRPSRIAGKTPGELREELAAGDEEPVQPVPWQRVLRAFAPRARGLVWSRPSRRHPTRVGEVPGRAPVRSRRRPRLLVAIDTSGSMPASVLEEIARQLRKVAVHAEVTIVECDCRVHRVYPFAGKLDAVMGRGGTDLRPVFSPGLLRKHGRDGVVYFTDGCGPFPERAPRVRTLWVLTSPYPFACPWGQRVQLPLSTELPVAIAW